MYGLNERGDCGVGDKKRLTTTKAICNRSIHTDFPSLGEIEVTDINQDKNSLRIYNKKRKKTAKEEESRDGSIPGIL